jgi:UDP-2-acetamido-3-amino-2,3-dideoxy-glucuronate N-acetyltransferase
LVKEGVSIGANSTIVCGTTLNENCLIGAGSVVTKDIKSNMIALGNPAVEIKKNKS